MMLDSPKSAPTAKTAAAIAITAFGQGWRFLLSILSAVILGRLLIPSDFGLVATIAPIVGFVDLLRDLGFSQAIVQREDVSQQQGHALFWTTMIVTLILGLFLAVSSPLAAAYFHEPRLVGLLLATAVSMQVASFSSQPWAWLSRHLRFKEIALLDGVQGAVGLVVSVSVALVTRSYWAIWIGGFATTITGAILATWRSGWRPGRPTFDRNVVEMARFGAGVSVSNVANFLSRNSDNFLIARASGPTQLGYYDRAYKLMLLPLSQITWPISRVLTPVLSRLQSDPGRYKELYLETISYVAALAQPALITAVVFSDAVVTDLLGQKWEPSVPIFAWLGAAAVHQIVSSSSGWLFLSQGRARDYAVSSVYGSTITVLSFLIGLRGGPLGVAVAYTIADYTLKLPVQWWYTCRKGPVRLKDVIRTLLPHAAASLATVVCLAAIRSEMARPGLLMLATLGGLSYVVYFLVLLLSSEKRRVFSVALRRASPLSSFLKVLPR